MTATTDKVDPNYEYWKHHYRLPPYVIPILYDVMLKPNMELGRFYGRETITISVMQPIRYIILHMKNLHITHTNLSSETEPSIPIKKSLREEDFSILELEAILLPGTYYLDFDFYGIFRNKTTGFFKCSYKKLASNRISDLAASKFEPIDARQAFPCFDEPGMKAKFKIRLARPMEQYVALTNEVIEKEEFGPDANEITVFFKETKPISTYLLGFIISDVKESARAEISNMSSSFPLKLYTPDPDPSKSEFAKEVAVQVLEFLIHYLEIPYPQPKLDLVSIPDFPVDSVSHWGVVTFKDTSLLFDEMTNSVVDKRRVGMTVAHEVSHQWFGALVSVNWWDDLWLSEGFATFMQYKGLEEGVKICRDWNLFEQVIFNCVQKVLEKDSLISSHPLVVQIDNATQVEEACDCIAVNKGLAVLKMLESFMGRENFRRGVRRYLETYQLHTATTSDLWECMNAEVTDPDVNVAQVMDTWTMQVGYPVIYCIRRSDTWVLSQSRYLSDPDAFFNANDSPYKYKWEVPIQYVTSNSSKPIMVWFKRSDECLKISISDRTISYLKFNHNQTGYYRVNYEGCLWKYFGQVLMQDHERLTTIDRANLVDDVLQLAEAGHTDYDYAFDLIKYLQNELEYLPWASASRNLKRMAQRLFNSPFYGLLMKFLQMTVGRLYGSAEAQFNWNLSPMESQVKRLLRIVILDLSCFCKLPECISDVSMKFKKWIKTGNENVHPDLRKLMMRYGMQEAGDADDWEVVWKRYLVENDVQIKSALLQSLASIREPWSILRVLEDCKLEISDHEYFQFLEYLSENPYNSNVDWEFIRNNWDYLEDRFSGKTLAIGKALYHTTTRFCTNSKLEEVRAFFDAHSAVRNVSKVNKICDEIEVNIKWLRRNREAIGNWLMDYLGYRM